MGVTDPATGQRIEPYDEHSPAEVDAALETATRLGLGYMILVFNDDYGLISETQIVHTGEQFGTELTPPDLEQFAESFGIGSYRPDT